MNRLRAYADDLCLVAGAAVAGVGVYRLSVTAAWLYAGAVLVLFGYLLARGAKA